MSRFFTLLALLLVASLAGCDKSAPTKQSAGTDDKSTADSSSDKSADAKADASKSSDSKAADSSELAAALTKQASSPLPAEYAAEKPVTYKVRQIVHLDDIKEGSKKVRMWVSVPGDDPNQKVHDLKVVSAPGKWSLAEDLEHRAKFVQLEVEEPKDPALDVEVEFTVTRKPVFADVDADEVGPLSDEMKEALAADLAKDSPHMEVSEKIVQMANEVCKDETNLAKQASLLMAHVAKVADHYSYSTDPAMPKCGIGDASTCLEQGGGCCTDLHSLFIALARSRGIPAHLSMGYRLKEANKDKLTDPGYRCWVEYYLPSYGWISTDIVEADTPMGLGFARWSHGLTARRVWLNQGRDYKLADDLSVGRVNHMSIAYAEIDGQPARLLPEGELKPQITRQVEYTEIDTPVDVAATAGK
jgi:transglutaminase-like putative cysteine protease